MVTPDTTTAAEVRWIRLVDVFTDHVVNTRPLDDGWVDARVMNFDPDKLGVPIVSARPDGRYAVIDGQHRVELARRSGYADQKIEAKVFTDLTLAQEAVLFLAHNDGRAVTALHRFTARITAGDPDAVAIAAIVTDGGWRIAAYPSDGVIMAVAALEHIWKMSGTARRVNVLTTTLRISADAWGRSVDSANGHMMRGLALVVNRYDGQYDTAAMVRNLSAVRNGALGVLTDARGLHSYAGGTVSACVAETVVRIYNAKRRKDLLPEWHRARVAD